MVRFRNLSCALLPCAVLVLCSCATARAAPSHEPDANIARSAVPDAYKWRLDPLFAGDGDVDGAVEKVAAHRARLAEFKGKLGDPAWLKSCLDLYFDTRLRTNKISLYGALRHDSHQTSADIKAIYEKGQKALSDLMASSSFIRQEVLAIDDEKMAQAYKSEPELTKYRPYLDELRRRRSRVLSAETERVLSLAGDNLWAEVDLNEIPSLHEKAFQAMMTDLQLPKIKDEEGKEVQLTFSNYGKYRASKDRRVRRDTVASLFGTLKAHQHVLAATFAGQINYSKFLARARGYDTVLEAYLDKDDINPAVYQNLINTIRANVKPLHDYVALRKEVMGLDDVHIYDLYVEMIPGVSKKVPYAEAVKILPDALAPLGKKYVSVLKKGLDPDHGWIDIYPHKDKDSGAFCASVYGVHPFVKMNYFDEYSDLSTLAHEYGHAVHSHLSSKHQPYVTSGYAAFNAEIASTTNEKLLSDYMYARAKTDDERLSILNQVVSSIRTTIYRQALFAEFELAVHTAAEKGEPITAEFLNDTYRKLIAHYYGPEFTVDADDDIEWAYIPHFYYKYYVFTYATGLSSGIALAEKVKNGGAAARDAYLGMLKGGSSKPPLDLLRDAGVDLAKPDAIEAAARLMAESIEQMRQIVAKRAK